MKHYFDAFVDAFTGTLNWAWNSIIFEASWYSNYFFGLVVISLIVWVLEILFPWRKQQSIVRKDFWLDGFYVFFNFFIFAIVTSGVYEVLEIAFNDIGVTSKSLAVINLSTLPLWIQLIIFFIILDFVQWLTHIPLHKYDFYGNFIKYIIR